MKHNEKMYRALRLIENPQDSLKNVIHVTGTVGKTSVCKYLSSILRTAGYEVNTYVSGNVYPNNDRIDLNGQKMDDNTLSTYIARAQGAVAQMPLDYSYDDILWIAALLAFKDRPSFVNIIEASQGNIDDPTNVFEHNRPITNVVCPIDVDHVVFNGNTPELNAVAQSATIYGNSTVVLARQKDSVGQFFETLIRSQDCRFYRWGEDFRIDKNEQRTGFVFSTDWYDVQINSPSLRFNYQAQNLSLALMTLEENSNLFDRVDLETIVEGVNRTVLRGQMEEMKIVNPDQELLKVGVFVDLATNQIGAAQTANFIQHSYKSGAWRSNAHLVMSADEDHDAFGVLATLKPMVTRCVVMENKRTPKPMPAESLMRMAHSLQIPTVIKPSISSALVHCALQDFDAKIICVGCASVYNEMKESYNLRN